MKRKTKTQKVATAAQAKFLGTSKFNQAILWFLTIPKEELSDSMLAAYHKMEKDGQNEIWLIDYFEQNLQEEIQEFIQWNNNLFNARVPL